MEKPTILQIPRRFTKQEWGGTESVILHTSQELARRGYEVRILTSDLLSAPGEEVVDGDGALRAGSRAKAAALAHGLDGLRLLFAANFLFDDGLERAHLDALAAADAALDVHD